MSRKLVAIHMGFEFTAIIPTGVIYSEPGMLLDLTDGHWPPSEWENMSDAEQAADLKKILLLDHWNVIPWDELDDTEVEGWYQSLLEKKTS